MVGCLVACPALWFPAYAGMTVKGAWNDGEGCSE